MQPNFQFDAALPLLSETSHFDWTLPVHAAHIADNENQLKQVLTALTSFYQF
jgi:hypothetical protein